MHLHRLLVFFPLTWLLGSPSKLHICGTILLSVRVCAPELERKGKSENKGKMSRPHLPFSTPRISPAHQRSLHSTQNGSKASQSPRLSPCSSLFHGLALETTPGLHLAIVLASDPHSAVQLYFLFCQPNSSGSSGGGGAFRHSVIAAGNKTVTRWLQGI